MEPIVISIDGDEPITLAEAAANLRVDPNDDYPPVYPEATRISGLITTAREACERELSLSLVQKTLEARRETWHRPHCSGIELSHGPVRSVASVTYVDSDGADQTLATDQYRTTLRHGVTWVIPAYGVSWPAARCDVDSIRVRYAVGYPSSDSPPDVVPATLTQAMQLYIAHYFKNREAVDDAKLAPLPLGVESLLWSYRQSMGGII